MEAATNRPMRAFNISKVSYARNLGRFAKCVLYMWFPATVGLKEVNPGHRDGVQGVRDQVS